MIYFSNTRSDPQAYSHTVVRTHVILLCIRVNQHRNKALANAYAHFIYGIPTLENASTILLENKSKLRARRKRKIRNKE
jgi:hypothetical protein